MKNILNFKFWKTGTFLNIKTMETVKIIEKHECLANLESILYIKKKTFK